MPMVSELRLVQVQPQTQTQQATHTLLATLSRAELGNFMDFVKDNARWRTLYGNREARWRRWSASSARSA